MFDIISIARFLDPSQLSHDDLYGDLTKFFLVPSWFLLLIPVLLFNDILIENKEFFIIISFIPIFILNLRMFFMMTVVFPFIFILLFYFIPFSQIYFLSLLFLFFCYLIAAHSTIFYSTLMETKFVYLATPFRVLSGLLLLFNISLFIYSISPTIIDKLLFIDILKDIFTHNLNNYLSFLEIIILIILFLRFRMYDISMDPNKKGYGFAHQIFYTFAMIISILNSIIPYCLTKILNNTTFKTSPGGIINQETYHSFESHSKSEIQIKRLSLLAPNHIRKGMSIMYTDVSEDNFVAVMIPYLFFMPGVAVFGEDSLNVERMYNYIENEGLIFRTKCYSKFSKEKEFLIYKIYEQINQLKRGEDLDEIINGISDIENGISRKELHPSEEKVILYKINLVKNKLSQKSNILHAR